MTVTRPHLSQNYVQHKSSLQDTFEHQGMNLARSYWRELTESTEGLSMVDSLTQLPRIQCRGWRFTP
jgi:hypothetical protein